MTKLSDRDLFLKKEKEFKQQIEENTPKKFEEYFGLYRLYSEKEMLKECIEVCNMCINRGLNDPIAFYNRGVVYQSQKDHERATSDYLKCIELGAVSGFSFAYYNLLSVYNATQQFEKGVELASRAIKIFTEDNRQLGDFYNKRGIPLFYLKRYEEAVEEWKKSIEINPAECSQYGNLSLVYSEMKKYEISLQYAEQAISTLLKTKNGEGEEREYMLGAAEHYLYGYRANALRGLKRFEEAKKDLEKSFQYNSKGSMLVHYFEGLYHLDLKDYDKAIRSFRTSLELSPKFRFSIEKLESAIILKDVMERSHYISYRTEEWGVGMNWIFMDIQLENKRLKCLLKTFLEL